MSILWAIPPVAVALGAALALVQLRGIAEAAVDLRLELQRFSEVRLAVIELRTASAEVHSSLRGLRRA